MKAFLKLIRAFPIYVSCTWYPYALGLVAFADYFLFLIPLDGMVIASILAHRKKWFEISFWPSLGSALGATGFSLLVHHYGISALESWFPHLMDGRIAQLSAEWLQSYGGWALFFISALPIAPHPVVILAVIARVPIYLIALCLFLGRLTKYCIYTWATSHVQTLWTRLLMLNAKFHQSYLRYLWSTLATGIAVFIQYEMKIKGRVSALGLLYPTMFLIGWYFGFGPALFAILLAAFTYDVFIFEPQFSFGSKDIDDLLRLGIFVVASIFITWIIDRSKKSEIKLREAQEQKSLLAERELSALKEAQDALQTRDEFISIASHELKTPLTSLHLQLQLLSRGIRKGSIDSANMNLVLEKIENCERQSIRLADLMNELLDLSRVRLGRLQLNKEITDLSVVIAGALSQFEDELKQTGQVANLHLTPGIVGNWDSARIEQVITNLISNAIKYGENKPMSITTYLDSTLQNAVVVVQDEGLGISTEMQAKVFERFERATSGMQISGLGLGLYISRQIVEAHGGTIQVSSNLNQGSSFTVQLPLDHAGQTVRLS